MAERVMVFAPAPVLTITIEPQGGTAELHVHPGGQGVWQARMIVSLGVGVTLCAAIGGEAGAVVGKLLIDEEISLRAVQRRSGNGWYVHDRRGGSRAEIAESPGVPMGRHDLDELYNITLAEGLRVPVTVLSGPSHPEVVSPDVYRRLASDIGANGGRVVADLSGEHLGAVLAGGVSFVKVSHEQLLEDGRVGADDESELAGAGRRLRAEGAGAVLVSRAEKPALAVLDGGVYRVDGPHLEVADPRGAGDSMSAGVAAVLARGGDVEEAVCTGAAAGALNVTRHGLGTGRHDAVRELTGRVRLTPLDGKA